METFTPERQTVLLIRGAIAELPEYERGQVETYYAHLKQIIGDDDNAKIAFALLGAELSEKA